MAEVMTTDTQTEAALREWEARELKGLLPLLSPSDRAFASSLTGQFNKKGALSDKQWFWVRKMIDRAKEPTPEPKQVSVGSCEKIMGLFETARKHVKHPKIHFSQTEGLEICLSLAGPRSKYAGSVMVTDGKPYGQNQWWGSIDQNGTWTQPTFKKVPEEVEKIVMALAQDPVKAAAEHGLISGKCCFCNTKLTDGRSTDIGYGPKCAQNFGLPWGGKKEELREKLWAEAAQDAKRFA